MSDIVGAYCDGGVIGRNPSLDGGTWAYCLVGADGDYVQCRSGVIEPGTWDLPEMSNNLTEYFAAGKALAALPGGWSGPLHSDSKITLGRIFWGWRTDGNGIAVPASWLESVTRHLERLGGVVPILLDGHPTKAQLAAGVGKRGNACSAHNVWCDEACGEQARKFRER